MIAQYKGLHMTRGTWKRKKKREKNNYQKN